MRKIKFIVIHCTDTPEGREVTGEEVDRWHRERGWRMAGYHYLVHLDGRVEHLRPEYMNAAACAKGNANSTGVHVCYVGGRNSCGDYADTRTKEQQLALLGLLHKLKGQYPQATICGHRDFDSAKVCPCFNAAEEYRKL